jgi:hypothetical protein
MSRRRAWRHPTERVLVNYEIAKGLNESDWQYWRVEQTNADGTPARRSGNIPTEPALRNQLLKNCGVNLDDCTEITFVQIQGRRLNWTR